MKPIFNSQFSIFNSQLLLSIFLLISCTPSKEKPAFSGAENEIKLMVIDPGHFHASLIQKKSYPQISNEVYVYAPAGEEVNQYLKTVEQFNTRTEEPTHWNEIVYKGDDFLSKLIAEKKGNVLITAGNNKEKINYIRQALDAGINVLADKPLAIDQEGFQKLVSSFETAGEKGVLLYDIMTERYEITNILQKELTLLPEVFGMLQPGTPESPAVEKRSVHHFFKTVAGNPLVRPAWYYDVTQQGEGIVDVTTHLVDLVQWTCYPGQIIDYTKDIQIIGGRHWPTVLSKQQFESSTGQSSYPSYLSPFIREDSLYVYANGSISYKLKDAHAKITVIWDFEAPQGGRDTHYSLLKGTKATLEIIQGKEQQYKPELYITMAPGTNPDVYKKALETAQASLEKQYPGVSFEPVADDRWRVVIPASYHVGHEAHFAQVTEKYLQYLVDGKLPDWEVPNMLAKYYTTTKALELAKKESVK